MKIIAYKANAGADDLQFQEIHFSKLNLIVGDSAAGKTRLLNTIFNGGRMAVRKGSFYIGFWDITFEHQNRWYRWILQTSSEKGEGNIKSEKISELNKNGEEQKVLVNRTKEAFIFNNKELPKLGSRDSSIAILQEENLIKPIYSAFSSIMRRSFWGKDLQDAVALGAITEKFLKAFKFKGRDDLFALDMGINGRLYMLTKYSKETYERICKEFTNIFPFISDYRVFDAKELEIGIPEFVSGFAPVFAVREKHMTKKWVPLNQLSSGMQKILLILTDIFTMPADGGIYLIDEFENSLGINAIEAFPSILFETETQNQFIITSHHPYIIGNVPVKSWFVLHRKGNEVLIKQGSELEERYGKSKQESFTQLINDPFFTDGIK